MKRLRGATELAFTIFEETVDLVERTQAGVWSRTTRRIGYIPPLGPPARAVQAVAAVPTAAVYAVIRGVGRAARWAGDTALDAAAARAPAADDPPTPLRSDAAGTRAWWLDHAESAVNGLWGSHLGRRRSPLDLGMTLRHEGRALPPERAALARALPEATGRIAVFVHGMTCTEWGWAFRSEELWGDPAVTFGTRLRDARGYTPLYVRYNSGRHVSENGRALSDLLDAVVDAYPTKVDELILVGHSMGGLVARSAARQGYLAGAGWSPHLRHVVCLGSPHLGAPLEKGINVLTGVLGSFEAAGARVPAELVNARSDGVKDLRFGYTLDEEWTGRDPDAVLEDNRMSYPPVEGVGYTWIAATLARDPHAPFGRLVGDILVRMPSAAGAHRDPARRVLFRSGAIFGGMHHLLLASHPDVYRALEASLDAARSADAEAGSPGSVRPR